MARHMDPTTKTSSEKVVVALAKVVPPTAAFEKLAATVRSHMAEVEELGGGERWRMLA